MQRAGIVITAMLAAASALGQGQIKRTSLPLADLVSKALAKSALTGRDARPFHIHVMVSEPENPQSPFQGLIEEWWVSPSQWRREVTAKGGMRQTIVVAAGKTTERDEGDYLPLWLRSFVTATFEPIPDAAAWSALGASIEQITMPNGDKSDACARAQSKIGSGVQATDAFSSVCFDSQGRVKFYGSPRYSMEFHDYRKFGKQDVARELADDPEPGTHLVGAVTKIEEMPKEAKPTLFTPLPTEDTRFHSVQVSSDKMEQLSAGNPPIEWPSVRSGKTQGRLAVYISADIDGHVREAWPLNSDNAGLDDSVREQVRHWTMKPAVSDGQRVQIDGGLAFAFVTQVGDSLPELTDAETRALATKIVEPTWAPGSVQPGQVVEIVISVNEQGKLTGEQYPSVPFELMSPVMGVISEWTFRPLMRDRKPQYFHGTLRFVVP